MFIGKFSKSLSIILIATCIKYFETYANITIDENNAKKIARDVQFAKDFSSIASFNSNEKWWYNITPKIPYKISLGFMYPDSSKSFVIYTHMHIDKPFKRKGNLDKIKSYGSSWNPYIFKIESFNIDKKEVMNGNKVGLRITFRQKISKNSYNDVVAYFKFVRVVGKPKVLGVSDFNSKGMNSDLDKMASKFLFGSDDLIASATISKNNEEKGLEYKYLLPCKSLSGEEQKRCEKIYEQEYRSYGGSSGLKSLGGDIAYFFLNNPF